MAGIFHSAIMPIDSIDIISAHLYKRPFTKSKAKLTRWSYVVYITVLIRGNKRSPKRTEHPSSTVPDVSCGCLLCLLIMKEKKRKRKGC